LLKPRGGAGKNRASHQDRGRGRKYDREPHHRQEPPEPPYREPAQTAAHVRCRVPAQRNAQYQAAQHIKQDHRGVGLDEKFSGGKQCIAGTQGKMRILNAAVAHQRERVADRNAQGRDAAQRLQSDGMPLKLKASGHCAMLPVQAPSRKSEIFPRFRYLRMKPSTTRRAHITVTTMQQKSRKLEKLNVLSPVLPSRWNVLYAKLP
jgi:hypothetical protein